MNIIGLSNKIHHFEYELGDSFFEHYGKSLVEGGSFKVEVALEKRETFIETNFAISGEARLMCDKSLESFLFPMNLKNKLVFKFGEEEMEISDEIVIITRDKVALELGQFIYEFIGLSVPIKKIHPRLLQEDQQDDAEGRIIYSSGDDDVKPEEIDPRWEKLRKLT